MGGLREKEFEVGAGGFLKVFVLKVNKTFEVKLPPSPLKHFPTC